MGNNKGNNVPKALSLGVLFLEQWTKGVDSQEVRLGEPHCSIFGTFVIAKSSNWWRAQL